MYDAEHSSERQQPQGPAAQEATWEGTPDDDVNETLKRNDPNRSLKDVQDDCDKASRFLGSWLPAAASERRKVERKLKEQKALLLQRLEEERAAKNKGKPKQIDLKAHGRQGDKDGKDKDGKGGKGGGFGDHSLA